MAAINDLISQIDDEELKKRITEELEKLTNQKKFGLVFEEHLPECVPLYDVPIKKGCKVALKAGKVNEYYTVMQVEGDNVYCTDKKESQLINFLKKDLVCIAEFGESIYPYLKQIDSIYKSDDKELPTHALIQADNYHALQLLEYLYAGKVDCIYIDPPYNTGARDWKYNNDYVDSSDTYRHSKWLSMMKKRLLLAKKLLNPVDSVMIVTIDEKEYLHLGCLLEELFPEARIQMVSSVINPKGNRRDNEFSRCEEYLFFVYFGDSKITSNGEDMLREAFEEDESNNRDIRLRALLRGASNHGKRTDRPNLFYPLLFEKNTGKFIGPGEVPPLDFNRNDYITPDGTVAMWPIGTNGTELTWNLQPSTLMEKHKQHFLSFSKWDGEKRVGYYLSEGQEENFKNGMYDVVGQDDDGAYIIKLKEAATKDVRPMTIWNKKSHSASEFGTTMLNNIFKDRRFSFPKSLYAVHDAIRFFVANKPNALIIDFFAGSGTSLHAVNLLNAEDNGKRLCIMVTNNEVSEDEAKSLIAKGFTPGDTEWERLGIANYVTWPRTVCSINGKNIKGEELKGNYIGSDIPMADGFKANAVFFKLGFLDKTSVQLGRQFKELLPLLWLKAGGWAKCPESEKLIKDNILPPYIILPENHFAVLIDEKFFSEFESRVNSENEIWIAYIVTDFEKGFKSMTKSLNVKKSYQLYRDYLDNFRINTERN
ncbi:site-specific DNA-methyltransferase [Treponema succinifaciens]|uniref:site-specific DNA-methyltransferase n=1 Tax=Treponema succinifaciens TaxID=167 RepID=UPI003FEFD7AD